MIAEFLVSHLGFRRGRFDCYIYTPTNGAILALYVDDMLLAGSSVRYGAGRGEFSRCDSAVTPARGQLLAVPPRPTGHGALAGQWGGAGILLSR